MGYFPSPWVAEKIAEMELQLNKIQFMLDCLMRAQGMDPPELLEKYRSSYTTRLPPAKEPK